MYVLLHSELSPECGASLKEPHSRRNSQIRTEGTTWLEWKWSGGGNVIDTEMLKTLRIIEGLACGSRRDLFYLILFSPKNRTWIDSLKGTRR